MVTDWILQINSLQSRKEKNKDQGNDFRVVKVISDIEKTET